MVQYTCDRCGYTTVRQHDFCRHLKKRKSPCFPKIKNVPTRDVYNKYFGQKGRRKIVSDKHLDRSKISIADQPQKSIKYSCKFCNKFYKHVQSRWRHQNTCSFSDKKMCEVPQLALLNQQMEEIKDAQDKHIQSQNKHIQEMKQELDTMKKIVATNKPINNTINIHQDIKILALGKSDSSHLTDADFLRALNKHTLYCVPSLLKTIHFNEKKPENHNVYVQDLNHNYIMVYDGVQWNAHNKKMVLSQMLQGGETLFKNRLNDWTKKKRLHAKEKYNRYLKSKQDKHQTKKVRKRLSSLLYKNREPAANNSESDSAVEIILVDSTELKVNYFMESADDQPSEAAHLRLPDTATEDIDPDDPPYLAEIDVCRVDADMSYCRHEVKWKDCNHGCIGNPENYCTDMSDSEENPWFEVPTQITDEIMRRHREKRQGQAGSQ